MKKFEDFISEVRNINDSEELESSCDMFDSYKERGIYNKYQKQIFINVYNEVSDRVLCNEIYQSNPAQFNYLRLLSIIKGTDNKIKGGNIDRLISYVKGIERTLKTKARCMA